MARLELPPPLAIDWEMKPLSSAETDMRDLSDGRIELTIAHDAIRGVTPAMLTWWFRTFPGGTVEHKGQQVSMYRLWHPRDHIRVDVLGPAPDGAHGVSKGARIAICERIGDKPRRVVADVDQMDESGLTLILRRGPLRIGELRHKFSEVPEGTLYRSRLVAGPTTPLIGRMMAAFVRRVALTPDMGRAWLKHNVEEVGNLEFFLPELYAAHAQRT
jgi:hypothetical protein